MSIGFSTELLVGLDVAIARIESRITQLKETANDSASLSDWYHDTVNTLDAVFLSEAGRYFSKNSGFEFVLYTNRPKELRNANRERAAGMLKFMIDQTKSAHGKSTGTPQRAASSREYSNKVFVVHGHDEAIREKVSTVLRKFDLDPIILNEKANRGMSILEKIEKHGEVGFAVVLFSADDLGAAKSDHANGKYDERPRQNVLIELGYFWGRLGRDRVCLLNGIGGDLSSDLHGLGYTSTQHGDGWKFELAKELKAAGYKIDVNKLI